MVELTDPTDISAAGTECIKKKPFGKHSVKLPPGITADAVVNANVADLLAAFATRSAAAIVNVTPLEPGWEGHVTLEFSNTTPLPAKIYANEGACQFLFLQGNEPCETSYADRAGKYMGQKGVTLPRL